MRATLDLHLCHHQVADHLGDQPDETVARRPIHQRRIAPGRRLALGKRRQLRTIDRLATTGIPDRGQLSRIRPPPNSVITYAEQLSNLRHPVVRHMRKGTFATAETKGWILVSV